MRNLMQKEFATGGLQGAVSTINSVLSKDQLQANADEATPSALATVELYM